ncbi:hypothetical protein HN587_06925 [Candidatus Woesearchaeota archaeon]|jgi:hypothetical protein|nr:hypothetical protein [Candidatus Woesearchaeota archaeon]
MLDLSELVPLTEELFYILLFVIIVIGISIILLLYLRRKKIERNLADNLKSDKTNVSSSISQPELDTASKQEIVSVTKSNKINLNKLEILIYELMTEGNSREDIKQQLSYEWSEKNIETIFVRLDSTIAVAKKLFGVGKLDFEVKQKLIVQGNKPELVGATFSQLNVEKSSSDSDMPKNTIIKPLVVKVAKIAERIKQGHVNRAQSEEELIKLVEQDLNVKNEVKLVFNTIKLLKQKGLTKNQLRELLVRQEWSKESADKLLYWEF